MNKWEAMATGREGSLFDHLVERHQSQCADFLNNRRIAVVGAAGSIGASVVRNLLRFRPAAISLIDISENNLVELTRELRSDASIELPANFEVLPIALGSIEFDRYFAESEPFDYFMNLSAMKHVRSEKNIYSLIRMLDTNVLFLHQFLASVPYKFKKVFSVSSDKGTNPANAMGASKLVMEQVLQYHTDKFPFATARFANVAFSDGSLPFGFLRRIEKEQPLAGPQGIRRYFISHEEAGQLCLLAFVLGENEIFFPNLEEKLNERDFYAIANAVLAEYGYQPVEYADEAQAKRDLPDLVRQGKWPCCFSPSDTSGEKPFEEFFAADESVDLDRLGDIGVIREVKTDRARLEEFFQFLVDGKTNKSLRKEDYIEQLKSVVPNLEHIERQKSLDEKM